MKKLLFCPQTSLQRSPVQHWWQEVNLLGRLLFDTGGKALVYEMEMLSFSKTNWIFKFCLQNMIVTVLNKLLPNCEESALPDLRTGGIVSSMKWMKLSVIPVGTAMDCVGVGKGLDVLSTVCTFCCVVLVGSTWFVVEDESVVSPPS